MKVKSARVLRLQTAAVAMCLIIADASRGGTTAQPVSAVSTSARAASGVQLVMSDDSRKMLDGLKAKLAAAAKTPDKSAAILEGIIASDTFNKFGINRPSGPLAPFVLQSQEDRIRDSQTRGLQLFNDFQKLQTEKQLRDLLNK